jgi:hypothetical protein
MLETIHIWETESEDKARHCLSFSNPNGMWSFLESMAVDIDGILVRVSTGKQK